MIYLELFWVFFQIGLFTIGGGYAAIPLIQKYAMQDLGWLTPQQFADLLAIDELTPGPIAINSATFVGMRVAGILGSVVATLGFVLPSVIIVSVLAFVFFRYKKLTVMQSILKTLRPAVAAAVTSAGLFILINALWGDAGFSLSFVNFNFIALGIFVASLLVLRIFKLNPVLVILGAGGVGAVLYLLI